MLSHAELKAKALQIQSVKDEYNRLEKEEMPFLDQILEARSVLGLTQAEIAEKMGTHASAIARLENALLTGKHSPTLETLRKYAAALGKKLEIKLV
jgi:predicted transcriptional regulator